MSDPEIDIKKMGPFFTGAIYGQMRQAIVDIEDQIAEETVETIQGIDNRTFKTQTPHARLQTRKHRARGVIVVDRNRLVYGPWLEDGGSRSDIFPGYHAFRDAERIVRPRVMDIANRVVEQHLIR